MKCPGSTVSFEHRLFIGRADEQKLKGILAADQAAGENAPGVVNGVVCDGADDDVVLLQRVRPEGAVVIDVIEPLLVFPEALDLQAGAVQLIPVQVGSLSSPLLRPASGKLFIVRQIEALAEIRILPAVTDIGLRYDCKAGMK